MAKIKSFKKQSEILTIADTTPLLALQAHRDRTR